MIFSLIQSDIDVLVDFMGTERLFARYFDLKAAVGAMFWQAGKCDSEYGTEKSLCKENQLIVTG